MRKWIMVGLFAVATSPAQESPAAPVFRSSVRLMEVSVVAQDKQGHPVTDLRQSEFQIFDNGLPQEIRLFRTESDQANASPIESAAPHTFTNRIISTDGSNGGYSVILIDNLFTDFASPTGNTEADNEEGSGTGIARTLQMLRSLPPDRKIAIYALGRKLDVICEFTSDRDLLTSQLRKWKPSLDTPKVSQTGFTGVGEDARHRDENAKRTVEAFAGFAAEGGRQDALNRAFSGGMEQLADHLAGIPGRKNLIWLAGQFVIGPQVLQKLNSENVAIYPVDVVGVCVLPDAFCTPRPVKAMDAIASVTGGVAYYGRNDLDVAIREAVDDGRISYMLGFYPSGDNGASPLDQNPVHQNPVHQISVKVSRTGIELRNSSSYLTNLSYQTDKSQPGSASPKAAMVQALERPIDATGIPIKATATRSHDRLNLNALLDLNTLDVKLSQGRWTGKIEMVARFQAADGKPAGEVISQTVDLNLTQATYEAALQRGISCDSALQIPTKAVELRLLFANLATGRIGTLTIPLAETADMAKAK